MAKLLRVRDRLLLGLSLFSDVIDEVGITGKHVSKAYASIHCFVDENYKKQNLYASVNKMMSTDYIEKIIKNGESVFRITNLGKNYLSRDFPLINLKNKKWDGRWRVVIFDIPEKIRWVRNSFRQKLNELGFGMVQKSVWISPHPFEDDIREFIKSLNLENNVLVFVANSYFAGDAKEMAEQVWDLKKLNKRYKKLLKIYEDYQRGDKTFTKNLIIDKFFKLRTNDPYLPKELLPEVWWGDKAEKIKNLLT